MAEPTIASRLKRRAILMTTDGALAAAIRAALPQGWALATPSALEEIGEYQEVLQHRFLLLDLDESQAFDPLDVIRAVRVEMMLNLPIFCFGGDPEARDEARLARADRFFDRGEIAARVPDFCERLGWGG